MAINEYGLALPADSDEFDPSGDLRGLGDSLADSIMVPVVNDTARDGLTAFDGLVVNRLDTGNLERYNGTDWKVLVPQSSPTPFVSRYKSESQNIPNSTYTKVNFQTVVSDGITSDAYNFTIPEDGRYQINTSIRFAGNSTGSRIVMVSRNESIGVESRRASVVPSNSASVSVALSLNYILEAGDKLSVKAFQSSGGILAVEENAGYTWVDIGWIAP